MLNMRTGLLRPFNMFVMMAFHGDDDIKDDAAIISKGGHCGIIYLK